MPRRQIRSIVASDWAETGDANDSVHAVAMSVVSLTFMVPLGIAIATTVRVGNAVGRGDPTGIGWAGAAGSTLVLGTQCISIAVLVLFPATIAGLYSGDAEVTVLATVLLGYAALFQMSDGLQALFNGALRGLEDTLVPAVITIVSYWGVGLTVGWFLGMRSGQGPAGLWKGLIAGLTASAFLLMLRFVARARALARAVAVAGPARLPEERATV